MTKLLLFLASVFFAEKTKISCGLNEWVNVIQDCVHRLHPVYL